MKAIPYREFSLEGFGAREIKEAVDLLTAYLEQGVPETFSTDNLKIGFNINSGYVFLTNEDYDVLMLDDGKLKEWHYCVTCNKEGFAEDIDWNGEYRQCRECVDNEGTKEHV